MTQETFRCGHLRTAENSTSGTYPQCRCCKQDYARRYFRDQQQLAAEHEAAEACAISTDAAIACYRRERALAEARKSDHLAPAKAAFAALLERDKARGKGGRPRKPGGGTTLNVGKPGKPRIFAQKSAPADALLEAVPYYGPGV